MKVLQDIEGLGQKVGSRDGERQRESDATYSLNDPKENIVHHHVRAINPSDTGMELLWYLAGEDYTELMIPARSSRAGI